MLRKTISGISILAFLILLPALAAAHCQVLCGDC